MNFRGVDYRGPYPRSERERKILRRVFTSCIKRRRTGGGPAADNFTLYYRAKTVIEWNVLKGIKDRTVTLQGLKTYTTYLCRVFAVNGAGISRPSPLSEFTTAEKGFYFFIY